MPYPWCPWDKGDFTASGDAAPIDRRGDLAGDKRAGDLHRKRVRPPRSTSAGASLLCGPVT
ncbi:hypothetical protein GCM10010425_71500 [Streptomyces spororaveus]|uniref:Uncharacterized protein n=1 Tax=Streptomyces spororaveus TaxID=284039 RepID=A0ABQ3T950_9ACTN|nr:hypothetical protein Sspor_24730 [Streptomyces spororaveus]